MELDVVFYLYGDTFPGDFAESMSPILFAMSRYLLRIFNYLMGKMGSVLFIVLNILPSTLSNLERVCVLFAIVQNLNTYTGHLTDKIIPFLRARSDPCVPPLFILRTRSSIPFKYGPHYWEAPSLKNLSMYTGFHEPIQRLLRTAPLNRANHIGQVRSLTINCIILTETSNIGNLLKEMMSLRRSSSRFGI